MSYANTPQAPKNYLVGSIVLTVVAFLTCCFCYTIPSLITGIVAIVFSTKVNQAMQRGDVDGAQAASKNARLWTIITAALLALGLIVWVVAFFAMGGMEGQQEQQEMLQKMLEELGKR